MWHETAKATDAYERDQRPADDRINRVGQIPLQRSVGRIECRFNQCICRRRRTLLRKIAGGAAWGGASFEPTGHEEVDEVLTKVQEEDREGLSWIHRRREAHRSHRRNRCSRQQARTTPDLYGPEGGSGPSCRPTLRLVCI